MTKKTIGMSVGALAAITLGLAVGGGPVLAAGGYSLFGDATYVHPGFASPTAVQLRSSTVSPGYGGIDINIPAGLTFSQIQNLSTDYQFTAGSCGGGAPRFSINFGPNMNAFVYIGPPPNYSGCPQNVWANTGNLATPASFVDTSQLPGGTFYDTFAAADLKYGSDVVTGIQLVTDAAWLFGTQTVLVDNVMINDAAFTFESKQSCKDGGWRQFTSSPGPFKNQGDCVSYFATGGTNG
jgi:hypothetical protein